MSGKRAALPLWFVNANIFKIMEEAKKRGGSRPGAGRKPMNGVARPLISCHVDVRTMELISKLGVELSLGKGLVIDALADFYRQGHQK